MWLRTDDRNEAVKSLHKVHQFIKETHQDTYNWKWVIIALHNSAQAFMVLALEGTALLNVCRNRRKIFEAIQSNEKLPDPYMQYFINFYEDIKSPDRMNMYCDSSAFSGSKEADNAMKRLNEFRNQFIHFLPGVWSLEISELPELCNSVLSVIEFLIFNSGNVRFYDNGELEKANLAKLILEIRIELENLKIEYKGSKDSILGQFFMIGLS